MPHEDTFILHDHRPAYLRPDVAATLPQRAERARAELRCCRACPQRCGVDRSAGETGFCGVGRRARVASAFAHFGEESCLRGTHGSGTIFFSGCNLHCVFCQNWDISQRPNGQELDPPQLAELMLSLQEADCHNVNLVTPEHVVPQVVEALVLAIDGGLRVPVVYNTSAYDAPESLTLLDGLIDIYMPDFKLWESATAARLIHAGDYPDMARAAIREMHRQVGDLHLSPTGVACRGLLLRHLVMPGLTAESAAICQWLATDVSPNTFVNLMGQYRPENEVAADRFPDISRRPTAAELTAVRTAARAAGLWRFDN
ncbi:MAG: radical SAM protein [Phycisphaerae bacterium]|jgi:putative pyruvate formate lyase activating enzyme